MVADFWSLSGPARFTRNVASRMLSSPKGILGVTVPDARPRGFVEAILEATRDRGGGRVVHVNARDRAFERSIPHGLARAGGIRDTSIHSVPAFVDLPGLAAASFIIDGVDRDAWGRWSAFLRSFSAASQRADLSMDAAQRLSPRLVVLLPVDLPRSDVSFLFGKDEMQWRGYVSPIDTRTYVTQIMDHNGGESLLDRVAAETIIRLAGWDGELIRLLSERDPEELADPLAILSELPGLDLHPTWSNGMIDEWDGSPFLHSLACRPAGEHPTLKRRLWLAHSHAITPFVGDVIDFFVDRYGDILAPELPYGVETRKGMKYIHALRDLEASHLYHLLNERIPIREATFLKSVAAVRNKVAHHNVVPADHLIRLSGTWEDIRSHRSEARGWDWPRCGQKLVLMVGPSGAGKSTLAKRRYALDSIVSSDAIRIEKYGSLETSDQTEVFKEVERRVIRRLAEGETVVLDATNLKRNDRLAIVDKIPSDIQIVYEVVDRPLAEKIATGDWRLKREGLIEGHSEIFVRELPNILAGDNRPNVDVIDHRAA
jgi:AAA domain